MIDHEIRLKCLELALARIDPPTPWLSRGNTTSGRDDNKGDHDDREFSGPSRARLASVRSAGQDHGTSSISAPRRSAQVAQLVEQRTENPCVGGSIPPLGTTIIPNQNSNLYYGGRSRSSLFHVATCRIRSGAIPRISVNSEWLRAILCNMIATK